jgi:DNA-binding response OmpR family regulator
MGERKFRILVVDDDEYSRDALTCLLSIEGYETRSAADGESGYASAREARPDLIVLDLSLPDLDGKLMISRIHNDAALRTVPILVVTGQSSDEAQAAIALGADAYFIKPIEFEDLLQAILKLKLRSLG